VTVEDYLANLPDAQRRIADEVRALIVRTAPEAEEYFGYGMPGYKLYGKPLVYFAAFKNHLGVYALPAAHAEFAAELAGFKQGKGSVQFPWSRPVPYALLERMVAWNAQRLAADRGT
jgi:uncharacterized protein YdhG (YjbR/CyaY superfamily)